MFIAKIESLNMLMYLLELSMPGRFVGHFCRTTVPASVGGQHRILSHVQLQNATRCERVKEKPIKTLISLH